MGSGNPHLLRARKGVRLDVCFVPIADIVKMPFNIDPGANHARDTPVSIDFQNSTIGLSATTCVGYVGVIITTPTVV
jgi:hypothetical protein